MRALITDRLQPKTFGGHVLTGTMVADFLPKLARHLNDITSVGPALVLSMAKVLADDCFQWFKVCREGLALSITHTAVDHRSLYS